MKTIPIPDYMNTMLLEQTTKERRRKQANLWKRNPMTGATVQTAPSQAELDRTARQLEINMGGR